MQAYTKIDAREAGIVINFIPRLCYIRPDLYERESDMEIFGGFMVMMSILSFFMAVVWLVMPFVVFTIKGKLDRTLDVLAGVDRRLAAMEAQLAALRRDESPAASAPPDVPPASPANGEPPG